MPVPIPVMSAWISVFGQHPVDPVLLDVDDLPADRQDRLELAVARLLGRAPGRVTLDDEQLGEGGVARRAVGQLAGEAGTVERLLRRVRSRALPGSHPGLGGGGRLVDDLAGLSRVAVEPLGQRGIERLLDERPDLGVAQLGLGLALELGMAHPTGDDRGEALPHVLSLEVLVLLLEQAPTGRSR